MDSGINVLSLFDGMGCGRIALDRLDVKVNKYFASEIDPHAIKVTTCKWPDVIHLGDVSLINIDDLPWVDLLLAGSPCQGFSRAGKGLNFKDPRSALFFELVRIYEALRKKNPKLKFLLENVQMGYEHELVISKILGINPIVINSTLVSAQNRVRLYWTNIKSEAVGLFGDVQCMIPQPKDKGIFLKDILLDEVDEKYYLSEKALKRIMGVTSLDDGGALNNNGILSSIEKSNCIDANYWKGMDNHGQRTMVITHSLQQRFGKGPGGKVQRIMDHRVRRLTPIECCRLQNVPDFYFYEHDGEPIISETQMYRQLGNGWTVDVIAHILSYEYN